MSEFHAQFSGNQRITKEESLESSPEDDTVVSNNNNEVDLLEDGREASKSDIEIDLATDSPDNDIEIDPGHDKNHQREMSESVKDIEMEANSAKSAKLPEKCLKSSIEDDTELSNGKNDIDIEDEREATKSDIEIDLETDSSSSDIETDPEFDSHAPETQCPSPFENEPNEASCSVSDMILDKESAIESRLEVSNTFETELAKEPKRLHTVTERINEHTTKI